jgi:hypothetical protein
MDENRELRAMLFSVIHIPPLPSIVSRLDSEDMSVVDDSAVESSHSIIGSMLEWTAMANNQAANNNRMNMQSALLTQFRSDLNKLDLVKCPDADLYNFYCYHTRAWLNTYSTVGNMMRFKPLDYVLNNDKTHQNMRGYTKAQYHLFTDGKETLELEDSVQYPDLLRKCAQWTKEAYAAEANVTENSGNVNEAKSDADADTFKNQSEAKNTSVAEQLSECDDVNNSNNSNNFNNVKNSSDEIYVSVQGDKTVTDPVALTSKVVTLDPDYNVSTQIESDETMYNIASNANETQPGIIAETVGHDKKSTQAEALEKFNNNNNSPSNSNEFSNPTLVMGSVDFF